MAWWPWTPQEPPELKLTADDLAAHASTLNRAASALLFGLAHGKYGGEVAVTEDLLKGLGVIFPPAGEVEAALEVFLFLNKLTAPSSVVPDGCGGFVPAINSRIDPKTGQFIPKG
jgi:hypothetical protein